MPLLSVDTNDSTTSIRATTPPLDPRQLYLVWAGGRSLSPLSQRFADLVVSVCATLLARVGVPDTSGSPV